MIWRAEEVDDRDFLALIAEQNRREHRQALLVARKFTEACRTGNVRAFHSCIDLLANATTIDGWRLAMKGVGRLPCVPPRIRRAFLPIWIEHKALPRSVGHRPTMAAALRVLMAGSYRGPGLTLFRGTVESEARRRLFGFSWSTDQEAATAFAAARRCERGAARQSAVCQPRRTKSRYLIDDRAAGIDPGTPRTRGAFRRGRSRGRSVSPRSSVRRYAPRAHLLDSTPSTLGD